MVIYSDWQIKPKTDADTGKLYLNTNCWQSILGKSMFNLEIDLPSFYPSFGSMISYFIRKHEGFLDAFKQSSSQRTWDVQTNNAYLLDLGWKFATDLQILRERKNDLDAFRREIKIGKFAGFMENAGKLEIEKISLEINAGKQEKALDRFEANPQYEQIEKEANNTIETIHAYTNQNVMDNLLLNRYNASLNEERTTNIKLISEIYQEAEIHFSEQIKKTLQQVNDFHNKIVENRKEFLNSKIKRLEDEIAEKTQTFEQLDK